jgi:lipoyl(octanoyl) transferase
MRNLVVHRIGITDYKKAWDFQDSIFQKVIQQKLFRREHPDAPVPENHLILCSHPHVYTLGKSGKQEHLLLTENELIEKNIGYYPINRGGDITYHGPGQLVAYPIFDLDQFYTDIHRFLRELEEVVIRTLALYDIVAERYPGYTGVWLDSDIPERARKICAMGIKCSRWVTMHGLALNVNTDLNYFKNIIPCGIDDKNVTSMHLETSIPVSADTVGEQLLHHLSNIFHFSTVTEAA